MQDFVHSQYEFFQPPGSARASISQILGRRKVLQSETRTPQSKAFKYEAKTALKIWGLGLFAPERPRSKRVICWKCVECSHR